jgi:hypothetical protein
VFVRCESREHASIARLGFLPDTQLVAISLSITIRSNKYAYAKFAFG